MRRAPLQRVLRFKHHLRIEPLGDERTFLLGERESLLLSGRLQRLIAPLLDGRRAIAELIVALAGQATPPEVLYSIMLLENRGYLVEVDPEGSEAASLAMSREAIGYWESLGFNAASVTERLAATPVSVRALQGEDPGPTIDALRGAGVTIADGAKTWVVVTSDYLDQGLEEANRAAVERKVRWMPVKPGGVSPWLGPMFGASLGPCWCCLAHRLRANRPVEAYLQRRSGSAEALTPPRVGLSAVANVALSLAAVSLARWIVEGGQSALDARLLALDPVTLQASEHDVTRRPQCAACGDPGLFARQAEGPIVLEARQKRFTDDGGHRVATPEETHARLARHISPITGVVASLAPLPGRDHPLRPVYGTVYRVCPTTQTPSFEDFHRYAAGKGRTHAQARTGALCEAIERESAIFQGDEPRVRARLSSLGDEAISPVDLQGFSEAQYRTREVANAGVDDIRKTVPLPFDERRAIDWTSAWSLTHARRRRVPLSYCYLYTPTPPEEQFCNFSPNGHAAGNSREEAILQAFFELTERDSVALWWYNRLKRPEVDLQSFDEPYFITLKEHYRSMGWALWVLDLTSDLGIPTFVALARATEAGRFTVGFGCHLEARLGVQRALTELNQIFDPEGRGPSPWSEGGVGDADFLSASDAPRRTRADFAPASSEDLREDVLTCVDRAARAGLETLVLDHSRPDVDLFTVKVIVPGLRHIWPRLGPGRLYDVPARLGWVPRPLVESELNPVPLFLSPPCETDT